MAIYNGAREVTVTKSAKVVGSIKAALFIENHKAGSVRYSTISGTVLKDSVGVARRIIIYNNQELQVVLGNVTSTVGTGVFTVNVKAGSNDRFRIICIGGAGENSVIFENVSAG